MSMTKYRSELAPEYFMVNQKAKLKPLGRWIGMSHEAKAKIKRQARKIYAASPAIPVVEKPVKSAKQARISRVIRGKLISESNHKRDPITGFRTNERIAQTGYLGVELRAIRRERGVGRPI